MQKSEKIGDAKMATKNQIPKLAGTLVEHQEHFDGLTTEEAQWVIFNPKEAIGIFKAGVRARVTAVTKKVVAVANTFLNRLGLTGEIPPTDGKQTIFRAKKTFTAYIDPDFKGYGLDVRSEGKPMLQVESLELVKDGTLQDIFGSFGVDLDRLVLTQDQIIWVVENRPEMLLQNGYANLFLMKQGDEYFVADAHRDSDGLSVNARRLSDDDVWRAGYRRRVVVPQL
jgi:hypothetical protein